MKKINLLLLFFLSIYAVGKSQCVISNSGFENWMSQPIMYGNNVVKTLDNPNASGRVYGLDYWFSVQDFASVVEYETVNGYQDTLSVFKSTNAHSGNYSLGLQRNTTVGNGGIANEIACTSYTDRIQGYLNFSGQSGDTLSVVAFCWDKAGSIENYSAVGGVLITSSTNGWQSFSVDMQPKPASTDTIVIYITLSGKGAAVALFDDFSLSSSANSVNELSMNSVGIFPNPSNGNFTLRRDNAENCSVSLVDVLGNVVFSETMNQVSKNYDFSQFEKGVYFLRVSSNTSTESRSVVIQ